MGFSDRAAIAHEFEQSLFKELSNMGFVVAVNGTEHTAPEFVKDLKRSTDQTSLSIRFQPDGVARIGKIPRSFYVEAKYADNIERLAYEQYMKLYDSGNIVVIVFGKYEWAWCFIEELPLQPAIDTVSVYPEERRFPIVDGWITPRASGRTLAHGSGTPYRQVIIENLRQWSSFKKTVIDRLSSALPHNTMLP